MPNVPIDSTRQHYTILIVQRFGVRIFGAFLPLPPFFLAMAATGAGGAAYSLGSCYGTELAKAHPSRRAQITRADAGAAR